jgi:hypothetical protein
MFEELQVACWWERLSPVAGPFAASDKTTLVLHQLDEQMHHGAELGLLRDLHRHKQSTRTTIWP